MLVRFFLRLRSAGVPVSITELMTLLEALQKGLGHASAERFYHLARTCLVKDERYYDRFDRVFAAHFKGAEEVGLPLRPTQLLLFGHPKGGTPLMQDRQTAGLDLPLKALAWEDEKGQVWLSYYTGSEIAARHGLSEASRAAVEAIDKGMSLLCGMAAGEDAIPM